MLKHGKPQIPDVFKNTLPSRLYWVLFLVEDLRQAVRTAKRVFTKERIDRQHVGQTFSTPFMALKDSTNCSIGNVSFDPHNVLGAKIGKLTALMSRLSTHNTKLVKQFELKIYHGKRRGQDRNNCFDRGRQKNRNKLYSRDRFGRYHTLEELSFDEMLG